MKRLVAMGVTDIISKERAGVTGSLFPRGRVSAVEAQGVFPQERVFQRGCQALRQGGFGGLGQLRGPGGKRTEKLLHHGLRALCSQYLPDS